MHFQYLGTAAAEAWPALFCQCEACQKARALGGKDIRGRSGALIDSRLMVDFPPDVYLHCLRHHLDLSRVEQLIVTHSHLDHFDGGELMMRDEGCYAHIDEGMHTLEVWGNQAVQQVFERNLAYEDNRPAAHLHFHPVIPFQSFSLILSGGAAPYQVTPLPARHALEQQALIYLIEKEDQAMLYGNDTGFFYDEVLEFLKARGVHLDFLSLDCTCGKLPGEGGLHMNFRENVALCERLTQNGNINDQTIRVITHFSHNIHQTHEELCQMAQPEGFFVAYDGMEIDF